MRGLGVEKGYRLYKQKASFREEQRDEWGGGSKNRVHMKMPRWRSPLFCHIKNATVESITFQTPLKTNQKRECAMGLRPCQGVSSAKSSQHRREDKHHRVERAASDTGQEEAANGCDTQRTEQLKEDDSG